jgi:hypothetical protein
MLLLLFSVTAVPLGTITLPVLVTEMSAGAPLLAVAVAMGVVVAVLIETDCADADPATMAEPAAPASKRRRNDGRWTNRLDGMAALARLENGPAGFGRQS